MHGPAFTPPCDRLTTLPHLRRPSGWLCRSLSKKSPSRAPNPPQPAVVPLYRQQHLPRDPIFLQGPNCSAPSAFQKYPQSPPTLLHVARYLSCTSIKSTFLLCCFDLILNRHQTYTPCNRAVRLKYLNNHGPPSVRIRVRNHPRRPTSLESSTCVADHLLSSLRRHTRPKLPPSVSAGTAQSLAPPPR